MKREEWLEFKRHQKQLSIFSRFDEGIHLSDTMFYSVTKEHIANKIAEQALEKGFHSVVDGCGGAGGNSIAFAAAGMDVAHVELREDVSRDARHNAGVYDVEDKIQFFVGDALKFDCRSEAGMDPAKTMFFSSPEWGGPDYKESHTFDVNLCNPSVTDLLKYVKEQGYGYTCLYLPRTSSREQLEAMGCKAVIYMFQGGWCNAICAWFDAKQKNW